MQTKAFLQMLVLATSKVAKVRGMASVILDPDATFESKVRAWHLGMDIPVREEPTEISVKDAESRLKLTLDEFLELTNHSGFRIVSKTTGEDITSDLKLVPKSNGTQNLVGITDGLCDIVVSCLGHAAEHGVKLKPAFEEVMYSNGTKISVDGEKLRNRCVVSDVDLNHDCNLPDAVCVLLSPDEPVGKILKPACYIAADIKTVLSLQGPEVTNQSVFKFPVYEESPS